MSDSDIDIDKRHDDAKLLLANNELDAASDAVEWLWLNALEINPSWSGVRVSFLASTIETLCAQHRPAWLRFAHLRDQLNDTVESSDCSYEELNDWFTLNKALREEQKSIDWVHALQGRKDGDKLFERAGYHAKDLLIENREFAVFAALRPNLLYDVKRTVLMILTTELYAESQSAQAYNRMLEGRENRIRKIGRNMVVAMKTGQDSVAIDMASYVFRHLEDYEQFCCGLIHCLLDYSEPREIHLDWLDAIENPTDDTTSLRARVLEALRGPS